MHAVRTHSPAAFGSRRSSLARKPTKNKTCLEFT